MNKIMVTLVKDCKIAGVEHKADDKVEVTARVAEILAERKLINR